MKVLFVSAEVAPFAKVGGLADVAASLPKTLAKLGHDVRLAMPAYPVVLANPSYSPKLILESVSVELRSGHEIDANAYELVVNGVPHLLIDGDRYFEGCTSSELIYSPTRDAYLFFSKAIFSVCEALGWIPDVIHANDWHTGFIPVLLREQASAVWKFVSSAFTIHNLAYQGEFGADTLSMVGLPLSMFNMHELETYGAVNFLKSGCVFSDQTTTVSPTYAKEIQTAEYGCRLEGLMAWLASQSRLTGILNGIDMELFDPATDPLLADNYSLNDRSGKEACKKALADECGFTSSDDFPIVGVVSRLSEQKGFDLILEALPEMVNMPLRLVILGVGDHAIAEGLRQWEANHPDRVKLFERFDIELAQRIYSGCDMFLMPSSYEPCGLGQMFAMRYGTVPIVRHTGGLADTVFEGQNGFLFEHRSAQELLVTIRRALAAHADPDVWHSIVSHAMSQDFGWDGRGHEYIRVYERAIKARSTEPETSSSAPCSCG